MHGPGDPWPFDLYKARLPVTHDIAVSCSTLNRCVTLISGESLDERKKLPLVMWSPTPPATVEPMHALLRNARSGLRRATRDPRSSAVIVACLGLGIGLNVTVYSLVNALLLRPLPIRDEDRLVSLWRTNPDGWFEYFSFPAYEDLRDHARSFDQVVARIAFPGLVVRSGTFHENANAEFVSPNYFEALGVGIAAGRGFSLEDSSAATVELEAIVSNRFWLRIRQRDTDLPAGYRLDVNGQDVTVIGVADDEFTGTHTGFPIDVWVPWTIYTTLYPTGDGRVVEPLQRRDTPITMVLGRLGAGVTIVQAEREAADLMRRLEPDMHEGIDSSVRVSESIRHYPHTFAELKTWGVYAQLAVALVLSVSCANVASLMLANFVARRPEIAVRVALGARRRHIVCQLLGESTVLVGIGSAVGMLISYWGRHVAVAAFPYSELTTSLDTSPDARVLLFALLVTALCVVLFGLGPALSSSRSAPADELDGSRHSLGIPRLRAMNLLVIAQIGACFVLLVAAVLFVRSLRNLGRVDPGFQVDNLLVATVELSRFDNEVEAAVIFYDELTRALLANPLIRATAVASGAPGSGSFRSAPYREDRPGDARSISFNLVEGDYFQAAGTRLVTGRSFTDQDEAVQAAVVVVSDTMARQLWPGEDPLGQRLVVPAHPFFEDIERTVEVIGVA